MLTSLTMETYLEASGWALPDSLDAVRFLSRLLSAVLFGAVIGLEREVHGMEAGLRTHILVALGAALFTLLPLEAGGTSAELAAAVRGIASGIGFIGAGTILKLESRREIKGLTTAASVWLTAAVGMAAGAGFMWSAVTSVLLSLFVLAVLGRWQRKLEAGANHEHSPLPKQ